MPEDPLAEVPGHARGPGERLGPLPGIEPNLSPWSSTWSEKAMPRTPWFAPSSAAPTVPMS